MPSLVVIVLTIGFSLRSAVLRSRSVLIQSERRGLSATSRRDAAAVNVRVEVREASLHSHTNGSLAFKISQ